MKTLYLQVWSNSPISLNILETNLEKQNYQYNNENHELYSYFPRLKSQSSIIIDLRENEYYKGKQILSFANDDDPLPDDFFYSCLNMSADDAERYLKYKKGIVTKKKQKEDDQMKFRYLQTWDDNVNRFTDLKRNLISNKYQLGEANSLNFGLKGFYPYKPRTIKALTVDFETKTYYTDPIILYFNEASNNFYNSCIQMSSTKALQYLDLFPHDSDL